MLKAGIIFLLLFMGLLLAGPASAAPNPAAVAGAEPGQPPPRPPVPPRNPKKVVSDWIKRQTYNPAAYEALDWSDPVFIPYGWHFVWAIRHVYAYEHPEYGLVERDDIFYFDPEGAVAGRANTSRRWRNQASPVPDWGWGWEKWGPEGKQILREEANRQSDNIGW
jgi:hypothetical protein